MTKPRPQQHTAQPTGTRDQDWREGLMDAAMGWRQGGRVSSYYAGWGEGGRYRVKPRSARERQRSYAALMQQE